MLHVPAGPVSAVVTNACSRRVGALGSEASPVPAAADVEISPSAGDNVARSSEDSSMQHPILNGLPSGDPSCGHEWDARAELEVAVLIKRYLADRPPPPGARVADDLRCWAHRLELDGRARLAELAAPRLRVA